MRSTSACSAFAWKLSSAWPAAATLLAYRSDKRRAESGAWRIPESTLHLAELLGGWPGAFLAQRRFRHKISKTSYQIIFWGIVALHEAFAIDSLVGWRFTQSAVQFIRSLAA